MGRITHPFDRRVVTLVLVGLSLVAPMSLDIYVPALPAVARDLHTTIHGAQYTMSLFGLGIAVGQLVLGPASDRFGRLPVIKLAMLTYVAASLVCLFATSLPMLLVGRALQGLAASAGSLMARAVVTDSHDLPAAAQKIALLVAVLLLGPAVGPVLGSYIIAIWGWRATMLLMAAFAAVVVFGVFGFMHESHQAKIREATDVRWLVRQLGRFARSRQFVSATAACAGSFGGYFAGVTAAPLFYMVVLDLPLRDFGWLLALVMSGSVIGAYATKPLIRRSSMRAVMLAGGVIGVVTMAVLTVLSAMLGPRVWVITAGLWLFYLSTGLTFANGATLASKAFPESAGFATAVSGFSYWGAGTVASALLGVFGNHSVLPGLGILSAMAVVSLAAALWVPTSTVRE